MLWTGAVLVLYFFALGCFGPVGDRVYVYPCSSSKEYLVPEMCVALVPTGLGAG